jgi:UPF0042 nucleotide-binding protein
MAEYLVVTGLSGAGRSTAAATLEDIGWFVIDNMPALLLGRVAELANRSDSEMERFCFVVGRGGRESVAALAPAIASLRASGARTRVLFLDASDDVLVRRYEGTRRRHPFEGERLLDAIRAERELLRALRDDADVVLDTSDVNVNELRGKIVEIFSGSTESMETAVVSFGFKHGIPLDVDLVLDCRFLPNPHWVERLRSKTGLDPEVKEFVLGQPQATEFVERLDGLLEFLLPAYAKEGKAYLSIAIGCTGGQHRSVVLAEEIASRIGERGLRPSVHHRDIDR